jgi:NAD+ kinase
VTRRVVLVAHPTRPDAAAIAAGFARLLTDSGITAVVSPDQADILRQAQVEVRAAADLFEGAELAVVLGGDGTILLGAELARGSGVPLLGLNLGHVGFLAEAEENELSEVASAVVDRVYRVEERLALDVTITRADGAVVESWALNEASVEKGPDTRMLEFLVSIDGHPLSRWGADGLVLATPTGSTAYAWSAGGPVVWPDVEALLVVPLSAHALFARPLVVSPDCVIDVDLSNRPGQDAMVWCDGRRRFALSAGDSLRVRRSDRPVPLARLHSPAFVARLVNKFHLPVEGWRGPRPPASGSDDPKAAV